ncbi:oxygen-independent coproporphyrinogen-3 oxidase [Clostridium acetobutylicum]|uniref:FeS oxidoreductases (HEMK related) YHAV B.subtilis ortholog n=1 Tax=Clostridium acetobutylicum (strain ATCC 824 / DSM 792 / JCM 1419 / IAM 19013 / LMG 5710 / NBRC 13948 / NRRL B-527 / VKM B-1787 / 2291 / W) TaxID=272562 RepID=Q97GU4_CLOAB|nr:MULTISPECIES: coproporphyrinogen III oxidase [Clostridium]AAK80228.1 FeS oxidoreductases (HEMK related) YHAV B.subtilis ortholog [Clostridium acetobutylicum ATCC 824]ADZ21323.1 coproporphyrinogen III oxidase [Clostridium acetobutylicum EA 2018]AEI33895.1 coproporphyrinogen III oxidase [Clostridium acetobutylicum DSM 1731]AWV79349.1 coproporphyrinogen III oxidase [Clostridium acetobutylicum]MBC2394680.1 coproporphyrinogen III oxidase [Clostridium acetobutylicum]
MTKIKISDEAHSYAVYHMAILFFDEVKIVKSTLWDYSIVFNNESMEICSKESEPENYKFDLRLNINENVKMAVFKYFSGLTGKRNIPWGTLIGIRPSKIASKLLEENKSDKEIIEYFKVHNSTDEKKAKLCIEVSKNEKKFLKSVDNSVSIYLGMPFCPTRCRYCSFISDTISHCKSYVDDYLKAMMYDIEKTSSYIRQRGLKIGCVYFGGGTPTSVSDEQFETIMKSVYESFIEGNNVKEFTVECGRPDSITRKKLLTMKKYKVHRISINPQTMNDETIKSMGRGHTSKDVIDAFNMAREIGFDNINMDIIIGLPGENLDKINNTCIEILKLKPESLTIHGLSLKRGSKLFEDMLEDKRIEAPNQDDIVNMFEKAYSCARELNMKPYYMYRQKNMVGNMENVGYSLEGKECIYNIQMIEDSQPIIAIGCHGVSKILFKETNRIERYPNLKDVKEYINRIEEKVNGKIYFLKTLYG